MAAAIGVSKKAQRTHNPIRAIVDNLVPPTSHENKFLNLALGDPTVHGNLPAPEVASDILKELLDKGTANGYMPSTGLGAARQAIATVNSSDDYTVTADDVIIASGCSGAIELALTALLDEGDNILVPKPFFPLYQVIAESLGASVKHYDLVADRGWECDLAVMDSIVDSRTKGIVITNPSNPCGSTFSAEHLADIAAVARKHNLPILADEIYGGCVFKGQFFPSHVYSGDVPVISFGGLAKEFVVPGWRVGWLVLHDKGTGRLNAYKNGLKSLTQLILGANSLMQAAIPRLINPEPGSHEATELKAFNEKYMSVLSTNAKLCMEITADCAEITAIEPTGAMYVMLKIEVDLLDDSIRDDTDFSRLLLTEENLSILPGQCFNMANFVRLVTCCPEETIREALTRMKNFCARHRK